MSLLQSLPDSWENKMSFLIKTKGTVLVSDTYIEWNHRHIQTRLRSAKVCLVVLDFFFFSRSPPQDLVYALLASLPRSSLLNIQNRIVPLLQLDVVGVSLSHFIHLLFSFSHFLSYSPLRWHYTYFHISHRRHSCIVA